ncbi:hypothetical protein V1280_001651 [Bradyrhizobium sp. AZCC 2230]
MTSIGRLSPALGHHPERGFAFFATDAGRLMCLYLTLTEKLTSAVGPWAIKIGGFRKGNDGTTRKLPMGVIADVLVHPIDFDTLGKPINPARDGRPPIRVLAAEPDKQRGGLRDRYNVIKERHCLTARAHNDAEIGDGSNFNSAPDVATNLLVPLQAKVTVEPCCCASTDCVKASQRTAHINLIDDRPSLLCQMSSSSAELPRPPAQSRLRGQKPTPTPNAVCPLSGPGRRPRPYRVVSAPIS